MGSAPKFQIFTNYLFRAIIPLPSSTTPLPTENTIPPFLILILTAPLFDGDIKDVVFSSIKNASHGSDGYSFDFYPSTGKLLENMFVNYSSIFF